MGEVPPQQQLQVDRHRVESDQIGLSFPIFHLKNRRTAGSPMMRWICQRHLEILLFNRGDGGSSGAIWKVLNISGLSSTSLCCSRKAVTDGVITEGEFSQIMSVFKQALPPEQCDPCSLGRIRFCTLLPIATAALVCRQHGRSRASLAWLRAFSQSVPESWELHEQAEQHAAANEWNPALEAQIEAQGEFEAEDVSFRDELTTMPTFSAVADDEERMKTYALSPVPPMLKKEMDDYIVYRTATFAARRQGGAVQSISAEHDKTCLLRFFGYLSRTDRVPDGALLYLPFMIRDDLGDLVQQYAQWLERTQKCKFSSIANYLNGLVSITSYCYANLEPSDALLSMDPNPLAQIINLRNQAEKASKTQQMYSERVGGWLEWEDVQKARVKCLNKLAEAEAVAGTTMAQKRTLLRDAAAISLLSLIPPDRVGCIRKLRLGTTLKRKEGGGWKIDYSSIRDGHKTSRFYGPFAASLPSALNSVLDKYATELEMIPGGDTAYLFHPPQSGFDRSMEPSNWTGWVKRLFKRWHGAEIAPKTLRSVFITWLRDTTSAPEVLKSAAHAMKHSEQRQASGDYDQEADDRLVKAAYEFNLQFAAQFTADAGGSGDGGGAGSSAAHAEPEPEPLSPLPEGPLSDEQIGERLGLLECEWADYDQTELTGTVATDVDGVHELLDAIGADACTLTVPDRVYVFQRSQYGDRLLSCTAHEPGADDAMEGMLVDNEWRELEGGPWTARLMRPSRQPVSTATYRNFQLQLNFDPESTPLNPCGQIKLPIIAGGPEDGVILTLPREWSNNTRSLMFRLKLSKAGATSSEVTINQILYRAPPPMADTEDEDDDGDGEGGGLALLAPGQSLDDDESVVPLAAVPSSALPAAVPAGPQPPPPSESAVSDGAAAAVQAAMRANHIELNLGLPEARDGTMAARARAVLLHSDAPLPGEGEAAVEPPLVEGGQAAAAAAVDEAAEEAHVAGDAAAGDGAADDEEEEPPAAPPPPPSPAAPVRVSERASRKRARFGDGGELDGPASSFRSAPSARKASVDPAEEMGVPAYAMPGATVLAMGLHAGVRKRFQAEVIKLRTQFPRIVVKYVATEDGTGTHPLELPDPITAYLTMSDVEPGTLLMP